ncbi:MAG: alpha-2-macroglobulin domain protein [Armatimonadetes bacterium]|nr:alpha-2-macroglobulin domain protein [Armatimonadota bacterium]
MLQPFLPEWCATEEWRTGDGPDPDIAAEEPYRLEWPQPRKVLYLYARARALGGDVLPGGYWWWEHNRVETAAAALEAYLAVDPTSPVPALLVRWLVRNRRGAAWSSTRETALAVQALVAYARATGELTPDCTLTLDLEGRAGAEYRFDAANALTADALFVVPDTHLQTETQTLTLRRQGTGTVYYTVLTRYFSEEDPILASSAGIGIDRRFYRIHPAPASTPASTEQEPVTGPRPNPFLTGDFSLLEPPLDPVGEPEEPVGPVRVPILPGDPVESGELLEVELLLQADNDYGYLLIEDIKPAGCEAVEQRSGYRWDQAGAYVEYRDTKVAFFLQRLTQLTYQVRAEAPGRFRVLPVQGFAMYAPEIRALSDEQRLQVRE